MKCYTFVTKTKHNAETYIVITDENVDSDFIETTYCCEDFTDVFFGEFNPREFNVKQVEKDKAIYDFN